jgi:hypothetical protein
MCFEVLKFNEIAREGKKTKNGKNPPELLASSQFNCRVRIRTLSTFF